MMQHSPRKCKEWLVFPDGSRVVLGKGVRTCMACNGPLETREGERVCRNPKCRKYVMSDYVKERLLEKD